MSPTPPAVLSTIAAGFILPRLRSRAGKRSSSNSGRQRHQVRASAPAGTAPGGDLMRTGIAPKRRPLEETRIDERLTGPTSRAVVGLVRRAQSGRI